MGMDAPHPHIRRHFVTLGNRQAHYRRAGKGPPAILLHQSPSSSRDNVPLMERLMAEFTVIAPDTPGNGLSDPLALDRPLGEDYARALAEFLDAVGIQKAPVFGTHTGGVTASEFARLFPQRVSALVVDGVTCWTDAERKEILANYLEPIEISWDGSHLSKVWARFRQQSTFFPWYKVSKATRLDYDLASPERMMPSVLDFLRADNNYIKPYQAAFIYDGAAAIPPITVPTFLLALENDVLFPHFDRLPKLAGNFRIERFGRDKKELHARVQAIFREHSVAATVPPPPKVGDMPGSTVQDYADVKGGQLHMRRSFAGTGRPVIVQHDAASDNNVVRAAAESFVGKRPVIAFDLPGNGESDNTIGSDNITCTTYAEATRQALAGIDIREVDYVGTWGSGFTGLELAKLQPGLVKHLAITHVIWHTEALRKELIANYTPDLDYSWYGGHMVFAWHAMRDQGQWWPWYNNTADGVLPREPYVDPQMIHRRAVSLLKCGNMWSRHYGAHWRYAIQEELPKAPVPVALVAPSDHAGTAAALKVAPKAKHVVITNAMHRWSGDLMPFFNS